MRDDEFIQFSRELFANAPQVLALTQRSIRENCAKANLGELSDAFCAAAADAVTTIDRHTESVIEKMLFNALIARCMAFDGPTEFMVLTPTGDAEKDLAWRGEYSREVAYAKRVGKLREYGTFLASQGNPLAEHMEIAAVQSPATLYFIPQAKLPSVKVDGRSIRVDALAASPFRPSLRVVVECDGYEWHSGKAAFTSDRKRDRALADAGYTVLRFAGSEIWANPVKAGDSLREQLQALRDKAAIKRIRAPRRSRG